jgi:predicted alpha/beta-hydrolase family hydrolase
MKTLRVSIPITDDEKVSGVFSVPADFSKDKTIGVILAHGAGNDMENPLIVDLAGGLAEAGCLTLRFNFLYKEKGRKAPDSQKKLEMTWSRVYRFLAAHPEYAPAKIVAAGKSMGGRVASQVAASGDLPAAGLVFLGYPLHPPGKKDQLRDAHLYDLQAPLMFFAGSRDPFCDLELLRPVLNHLKTDWTLDIIDGGDHSFRLPKSADISQQEVHSRILDKTVEWLKAKFDNA